MNISALLEPVLKNHYSHFTGLPLVHRMGVLSSILTTFLGVLYFVVILISILTGKFVFPPAESLQVFAGIVSLVVCPIIVTMMASLHEITPPGKRILSQISLGFTLLFALAVSINRFSQLGVVRQAVNAGNVDGIARLLAYGDYSVMLGIEYLGWSWFLGLAMLFSAFLFSRGRIGQWLRWSMLTYGVLSLISAVGFLLGNWLSMLAFVAWGIVLFIVSGLLTVHFWRGQVYQTE